MSEPVSTTAVFQPDLFKGKVAFVTGGGSGICKGMTEALMRHGAKSVIVSRTLSKLEESAKELSTLTGNECFPIAADVRNFKEMESAFEQAHKRFGRIDIVICGAAGNFLAPAEKLSANGFKTVIDIDLIGTFNTAKAALPYLKETKGTIISVSATFHYAGTGLQVHCAAAKAGVDAITRTLAVEWGHYGIRVNAIAPGPIQETTGLSKLSTTAKQTGFIAEMEKRMPLQAAGRKLDIAQATVFLASPAARWITGEIMVVDGGHWLTSPGVAPPDAWRAKL
ncbi:hypothetical protein HK097_003829 [Rhizophlyctis rosea]|uniref:2,4-dienoyl-CoA reductase [(3E)-enoyl-CoA-producing] n=1 Tax=Rhizophlyctis rosea TaxID=64517 RepID=A0AAD5S398_9FUNG|nr:hypothetical protein HK097_003829 [Rhizophlyctis rosea]